MPANRIPLEIRFRAKYIELSSGCWQWTAAKDRDGYGCIQSEGEKLRAHRVAWQMANGKIGAGMVVCHHCDNPSCVNPAHLFLGTVTDNNEDMYLKGRNPKGEAHGMAKLSLSDAMAIRQITGVRAKDIAKQYRVSKSLIGMIRQGLIWQEAM